MSSNYEEQFKINQRISQLTRKFVGWYTEHDIFSHPNLSHEEEQEFRQLFEKLEELEKESECQP